jgi:hypothetical protein
MYTRLSTFYLVLHPTTYCYYHIIVNLDQSPLLRLGPDFELYLPVLQDPGNLLIYAFHAGWNI